MSSRTVTRGDLVRLGLGAGHGAHLARTGAWVRAAPSTYLLPGARLPERVDAALEHAGRDGVVTGWAACTLLGLEYVPDGGAVDVLVPAGRRRVSTPYVRPLPTTRPPAWSVEGGVRLAATPRAVVDTTRRLTDLRAVRAVLLAAARCIPPAELEAELRAGARGGRALTVHALRDARAGAASAPEAEVADLAAAAVRAGRLPRFLLNADLYVGGVLIGRPDGWVRELALGWEVDSQEHHGEDDQFEATLARHDRFLAHGLPLLHVTPRRLRDAGTGWTDLLAAAAAARRTVDVPAGLVVRARFPLQP